MTASKPKRFVSSRLGRKIRWSFSGFTALTMALMLLAVVHITVNMREADLNRQLSNEAVHSQILLANRLQSLLESSESLSSDALLIGVLTDGATDAGLLRLLANTFGESRHLASFSLVDFAGEARFHTGLEIPSFNDFTALREALADGSSKAELFGETMLLVVVPVVYYNSPVGALVVGYDLLDVARQVLGDSDDYSRALLYQDRTIFSSQTFAAGTELIHVDQSVDRFSLPAWIRQLGLTVRVSVPESEFLVPVLDSALDVLLLGILVTAAAMFLALVVGDSIAQPILQLVTRVARADGSPEYHCAPLGTNDELEMLAESFDARTSELLKAQENLEQRVRERTQNLLHTQERLQLLLDKLQENSEYLEQAQQIADLGYWAWDIGNGTLIWSEHTYRIFGYEPDKVMLSFRIFSDVIVPEDRERVRNKRNRLLKTVGGLDDYTIEYSIQRPDNSQAHLLEKARLLTDEEGRPFRMLATIQDITVLKMVEDQLVAARDQAEKADMAKSRFLANMSHEIRTPMNAVINFTRMALRKPLDDSQREYLEAVLGASQHLLGIINDILDFSKIEANKLSLESVPFSIEEIAEQVLRLVDSGANEGGVDLLLDLDPDLPRNLVGDPLRLRQVISNLLGNALKFTHQGVVILSLDLIHWRDERAAIEISVCDSGIGMSRDHLNRLFVPFTQADDSISRRFGGTGLGLTISRRLLALMGCELYVESSLGQGSTFSFVIELDAPTEGCIRDQRPQLEDHRVLLVISNPVSRELLREHLVAHGAEVEMAESPQQGLELVQSRLRAGSCCDLVLLDQPHARDQSFLEFPARLHALIKRAELEARTPLEKDPRIMLFAADNDMELRERALRAGFEQVFEKPLNPTLLFDHLIGYKHSDRTAISHGGEMPPQIVEQLAGKWVLLVEDNETNQRIAQELVRELPLELIIANNGREALQLAAQHQFDLILMDLEMPEMGGYEATERLRQRPDMTDVPIVAMTAHAMSEVRDQCLAVGMNDHLTKPIDVDIFYNMLVRWMLPEGTRLELSTIEQPLPDEARPLLERIEVAKGLRRVGNNWTAYREILLRFQQRNEQVYAELVQQLELDQLDGARALAHRVKGVAGNLGADALQAAAARLERLLAESEAPSAEALKVSLEDFRVEFAAVHAAIAEFASQQEESGVEGLREMDPALRQRAIALAAQLEDTLETDFSAARKHWETLSELLGGHDFGECRRLLEEAIADYETDVALAQVKGLRTALENHATENGTT